MRRIEETDSRGQAIAKFDSCMERFFNSSKILLEELKKIPCCDENNVKIYTLAMNYYHDTNLVVDIATAYYDYIAYSMLCVDFPKHDKLYRRFESDLLELTYRLNRLSESDSIVLDSTLPENISLEEQLAIMDKSISEQLDGNGILYFKGIIKNLSRIKDALNSLQVVGAGRTASSYEEIYDRMAEEYYNSDLWENLKNRYISTLVNRTFKNTPITYEKIDELINELYSDLGGHEELGCIWEAYEENKTELSKAIVKKEYESATYIEHMFAILGKIELLQNWKEEIKFEELPCEEAEEATGLVQDVIFINEREEERFTKAWPEIKAYMEEVMDADYAWCCLHHTMTFYHYIKKTSFKFFMRWLNNYAEKELISEVNIRQVSFHYFIDVVETKWSLDEMVKFYERGGKQKITPQLKAKYNKYSSICLRLREILMEH